MTELEKAETALFLTIRNSMGLESGKNEEYLKLLNGLLNIQGSPGNGAINIQEVKEWSN